MVSIYEYFQDKSDFLIDGLIITIKLCTYSLTFGFIIAIFAALAKISSFYPTKIPATLYIEVFRGTPLLVQLYVMSFAYPIFIRDVLGIPLEHGTWTNPVAFWDAVIILSLNTGAYQAEIIRAGIESLPVGQTEAARSIGLTHPQSLRYIVLPQAFRVILPPLANEVINLVLNSSLASVLVVQDLTYVAKVLVSQSLRTLQIWFVVGLIYLSITLSISRTFQFVEKKYKIPGLGTDNR